MDHPLLDASSTNVINFLSIWLSLRGGGVYYIHFCYKDKHIQGFILRLLEQQRGFVIEMVESSHNSKCNVQFQKFWVWSSYLVILVKDRISFLDIWLLRGKVSSFSSLSFNIQYPFFCPNIIFRLRPGGGKWQWRPWWRGVKLALKLKTGGSSRFPQSIFRIFRVFRIVKIFRVFRIFRILREYRGDTKILTFNIKLKTAGESRPHAQYIQN